MRLRLVPEKTTIDFFRHDRIADRLSGLAMLASVVLFLSTG